MAEHHGISREDIIAFGDMPNDLEMLEWAGCGVAMGNAHPALADVSDATTLPHHQAGVAKVLEHWF